MASDSELASFENVIKGALSEDNGVRRQAEAVFQRARAQPDIFLAYLLTLVQRSPHLDVKQFCLVMIRQTVKRGDTWNAAQANSRLAVRQGLLELLASGIDMATTIRRNLADAVGVLASSSVQQGWPELLPAVVAMSKGQNPQQRDSALEIIEVLVEFTTEVLRPHFAVVKSILLATLQDQSAQVRLAAVKCAVSFVIAINDNERKQISDLAPLLIQTVPRASNNEDDLADVIEALVNLPRCEPTYLRGCLKSAVETMAEIVKSKQASDLCRRMAFEFLLTLVDKGSAMVRKMKEFPLMVIPLAFQLLVELKHTPQWDTDTEDEDEQQNFNVGLEAIHRLAVGLGGRLFLGVGSAIVKELLTHQNWIHCHAGLLGLAMMAEGCKKQLTTQLPSLVGLVLPFLAGDKHPRLKWAALNAIAQFSLDFAPGFQNNFAQAVVPAIVNIITKETHPRLVRHGALCLTDFTSGMEQPCLLQYLPQLSNAIIVLLSSNQLKVQEAGLMALAAVAMGAETGFTPAYDTFMPRIHHLLLNTATNKSRDIGEVRAKALDCVGCIAVAVGKEKFGPDAAKFMQLLLAMSQTGFSADDPSTASLLEAIARVATCIGKDFAPYLPTIIPPLLKSAALDKTAVISDADEPSELEHADGYESVTVAVRAIGNKRISVNTALLEEKAYAMRMLAQYSNELQEEYYPWVGDTARIVVPLLGFEFNDGIRESARHILPALLSATHHYVTTRGRNDVGPLRELWGVIVGPLAVAAKDEFELESLAEILNVIGECLGVVCADVTAEVPKSSSTSNSSKSGSNPGSPTTPAPRGREIVSESQASDLTKLLVHIISDAQSRRKDREGVKKSEDYDEEEQERLEEENNCEDELLAAVHLVMSNLCRALGGAYTPIFDAQLHSIAVALLNPNLSTSEIQTGLCMFDDVILYCGENAVRYIESFLPHCFNFCGGKAELRQSAAFGVGVCAQSLKLNFKPYRDKSLQTLIPLITGKNARNEENAPTADNAISAVGKILRYCYAPNEPPTLQGQNLCATWLSWLPVSTDEEEAEIVHQTLCELVLMRNVFLLGQKGENMPQIVKVLAHVLETACIGDNGTQLAKQILRENANNLASMASRLSKDEQEKIQRALS